MNKTVGMLLLAMPLAMCSGCKEEEGSTAEFLRGADGVGAVLATSCEELKVEQESITFDLRGAGKDDYGSAVAEYVLANRGEEDVCVTMLLPFGRAPEYGRRTDAYLVSANGEEVTCRLRHSYAGEGEFSLSDVKRLSDIKRIDAFYTPELNVTEYVFEVNIPGEGNIGGFEVFYLCNPNRTKIAFSEPVHTGVKNGWAKAYLSLPAGKHTLSMYAFGDPPAKYAADLYEEGKGMAQMSDRIAQTVKEYRFSEFALRDYTAGEIAETDYYNAYVDMLNDCAGEYALSSSLARFGQESCMAWYEYTLTVPSGERVSNKVTTPLYPSVSNKNGGCRYDYAYRLSLLYCFGDCERLSINVLTEDKLTSPSFPFEKAEGGYTYACDFLPQGELAFVVSDADRPVQYVAYGEITPAMTSLIVMLVIALVCAVTAVSVYLAVKRKQARELAPQNGRTEEGKVDLDDGDESPRE